MKVHCRSCDAAIPADDVNIDNLLAKCRECDTVFDISQQVRQEEAPTALHSGELGRQRRRPRVPLPAGIKMTRTGPGIAADHRVDPYRRAQGPATRSLQITRRWFASKYIGLLFFCIAWDSFLLFWYAMAGATGSWLMIVFPVAHVAVGVGLTYSTIAGLLNRTRIKVTDQQLSIRHGPIPWRGNHDLTVRELEQLYVQRTSASGGTGGTATEAYNLCAVLRGGRKLVLLKNLNQADQGLFMEQEIEELLGIVDVEVGDEYKS